MTRKRLNVQEQIAIKKDSIIIEAKNWRANGMPKPLEQVFEQNEIDINKSIVFDYE